MSLERDRYHNEADRRFEQSRIWREKVRPAQLWREPLCRFCKALGRVVLADTVDHVQRPRGDFKLQRSPSNLQSLCRPHHNSKSQWERSGSSRPLRLGTDITGWTAAVWTPETGIVGGVE